MLLSSPFTIRSYRLGVFPPDRRSISFCFGSRENLSFVSSLPGFQYASAAPIWRQYFDAMNPSSISLDSICRRTSTADEVELTAMATLLAYLYYDAWIGVRPTVVEGEFN